MLSLHRKALPIALILAPASYLLMGACGLEPNLTGAPPPYSGPAPVGTPYTSDYQLHALYSLQKPTVATRMSLQLNSNFLPRISLIAEKADVPSLAYDKYNVVAALPSGTHLELVEMRIIFNDGIPEAHPLMIIKDPKFSDFGPMDAYHLSIIKPPLPGPANSPKSTLPTLPRKPSPPSTKIDHQFLLPLTSPTP